MLLQDKKGNIEWDKLGEIVFAAVTLVLLVVFLWNLHLDRTTKDLSCDFSLEARSAIPTWFFSKVKETAPAICEVEKTCLTEKGGNCTESFAGTSYTTEVLPSDKKEAKEKIEETVANAFYECWKMTGGGKREIFGADDGKTRCFICSRLSAGKIDGEVLRSADVIRYMQTHSPPKSTTGQSYLDALSIKSSQDLKQTLPNLAPLDKTNVEFSNEKTGELAVVFMQVTAPQTGKEGLELAGGVILGRTVISQLPLVNRLLLVPYVRAAVGIGTVGFSLQREINSWGTRMVAASRCGTYENRWIGGKGSTGCSVLQTLPYDSGAINQLCDVIEGEA